MIELCHSTQCVNFEISVFLVRIDVREEAVHHNPSLGSSLIVQFLIDIISPFKDSSYRHRKFQYQGIHTYPVRYM